LNDLTSDKNEKKQQNKSTGPFKVDNTKVYGDIEDDLAVMLNDKQVPKAIESNENDHQKTK
jgi:hypothetical protein